MLILCFSMTPPHVPTFFEHESVLDSHPACYPAIQWLCLEVFFSPLYQIHRFFLLVSIFALIEKNIYINLAVAAYLT